MNQLTEKVAYLKGLSEGLGIDEKTSEGKLLTKIIGVLDDITSEIMNIVDNEDELQAQIDEIDDDLAYVEEYLFDEDDSEDDDFDCEDFECPNCGEVIYLDSDLLNEDEEDIVCPSCGQRIELECDCDCDCGCCDDEDEE